MGNRRAALYPIHLKSRPVPQLTSHHIDEHVLYHVASVVPEQHCCAPVLLQGLGIRMVPRGARLALVLRALALGALDAHREPAAVGLILIVSLRQWIACAWMHIHCSHIYYLWPWIACLAHHATTYISYIHTCIYYLWQWIACSAHHANTNSASAALSGLQSEADRSSACQRSRGDAVQWATARDGCCVPSSVLAEAADMHMLRCCMGHGTSPVVIVHMHGADTELQPWRKTVQGLWHRSTQQG